MTQEEALSETLKALNELTEAADMSMEEILLMTDVLIDSNLGHHSTEAKAFEEEYVPKVEALRKINLPQERQQYWNNKLDELLQVAKAANELVVKLTEYLEKFTDLISQYNLEEEVTKRRKK